MKDSEWIKYELERQWYNKNLVREVMPKFLCICGICCQYHKTPEDCIKYNYSCCVDGHTDELRKLVEK
jgi:hypothetical protein